MDYRSIPRESRPPKKFFPEYRIWRAIKWRCSLPHWIEKGITLDPEWLDFWSFYEELGPRPSPTHSVDRIAGEGGYGPGKCRWATPEEQAQNKKKQNGKRYARRSSVYDPVTGKLRPTTSGMPEYNAWIQMRGRCQNPNYLMYYNYGGCGIKVCPEWDADFWVFFEAIGPRPSKEYSLDRIDPFKDYEPGNVRWAPPDVQAANRKYHRRIVHNGEELIASQWSKRSGIDAHVIYCRHFDYGWPAEKAIWQKPLADERAEINDWATGTKKSQHNRKGMILGDTGKTLAENGKEIGVDPETLRKRLKAGTTEESALMKESKKHGVRTDGKTARGGVVVTFRGETRPLSEWSRIVGIDLATLYRRYRDDLNVEEIEVMLTTPAQKAELIEFGGESRTLKGWAEHLEIPYETVRQRYEAGKSLGAVFEKRSPIKADFPQLEPYVVGSIRTVNGRELAVIRWNDEDHTLPDWAKTLGVSMSTMRWRLNKNLPLEQVFKGL